MVMWLSGLAQDKESKQLSRVSKLLVRPTSGSTYTTGIGQQSLGSTCINLEFAILSQTRYPRL